jgi:hypothetical protein
MKVEEVTRSLVVKLEEIIRNNKIKKVRDNLRKLLKNKLNLNQRNKANSKIIKVKDKFLKDQTIKVNIRISNKTHKRKINNNFKFPIIK